MAALTAAVLGLSALGTALSARGSAQAAKGARKQGAFEGSMYDRAAQDATQRGELEAYQIGAASRHVTGEQRATLAASGVDVGSGSAADLQESDQRRAAIDEQTARYNASIEAFGFTEQAQLARMGGRNAAAGYKNQMYSTLIGGAADLYKSYRAFGLNRAPTYVPATGDLGSGSVGAQIRGYAP